MGEPGANKKVAHGLVALSSAAVLAVYSAGYQRTKAAAERFEQLAASRRHAMPAPAVSGRAPVGGAGSAAGASAAAVVPTPAPVSPAVPAPALPTSSPPSTAEEAERIPPTPEGDMAGRVPPPLPSGTPSVTRGSQPPDLASVPSASAPSAPSPEPPAPAPTALPQPAAAPAETEPTLPGTGRFKDGTYQGRGSCIHGDIQAEVVVKGGRIVQATISSCETRYSCDWLDPILPQVVARQSAFVDYVSGATDSTDAFSAAVSDALLKAQ